ncbi:MAG: alpha-N-arabinofuranosidase [Thermoproteota archaeon]
MGVETTVFVNVEQVIGKVDRRIYGQFIEHLGRCIYGGIWVGEESPIPNVRGFRKDVLEAVKALKPPIVRWPGGNFSSGYHWLDGVGRRPERPVKLDMAWNALEPNQFGTDEFIEWCRLIGTEPFIVVNAGNGTPEEAANWVEYTNIKGESKYATLRRANGHPEPFNVNLWGIGNELFGSWQIGFCMDAKECARRTIEFVNQMHKVDHSIRLVVVGNSDPEWNTEMIKTLGKYISYLSVHIYVSGSLEYWELLSEPVSIERKLNTIYELVQFVAKKYASGNKIGLAFDEWNVWYPEATSPLFHQNTSVRDGLFTSLVLNSLLRLSEKVPIACFAQTVNVLPLIVTRDDGTMYINPQYLAFKMYVDNTGEYSIKTSIDAPCYYSKNLDEQLPILDASATISSDKRTLYVYAVNKEPKESAICEIRLRGFVPSVLEHVYMCGEKVDGKNDFDHPDNVKIETRPPVKIDTTIRVELPPHSVNVLVLRQ